MYACRYLCLCTLEVLTPGFFVDFKQHVGGEDEGAVYEDPQFVMALTEFLQAERHVELPAAASIAAATLLEKLLILEPEVRMHNVHWQLRDTIKRAVRMD